MSGDIVCCVLFCENMALRSMIARLSFYALPVVLDVQTDILRKNHAFLSSSDLAQTFRGQKEGPRNCFLSVSFLFPKQLQQEGVGRGLVSYDASFSSVHCSYHYSAPSFCIFFHKPLFSLKEKRSHPKLHIHCYQ